VEENYRSVPEIARSGIKGKGKTMVAQGSDDQKQRMDGVDKCC
jgi:hypothetical protein